MIKPPDVVADDLRRRIAHVVGPLQAILNTQGALTDPRGTFIEITIAVHELEAALSLMRRHRLVP